ncbi:hypothetical protein [Neptunomonas sp.]|uniref:hypothetical protein n=1 Tax=Neptunomonas TaxID=75687 RepID=UPI0035110CEB
MNLLVCDSEIFVADSGYPDCSTGWIIQEYAPQSPPLTIEEYSELKEGLMLMLVIAGIAKLVKTLVLQSSTDPKGDY